MIFIVGFLVVGIIAGMILHKRKRIIQVADRFTMWTIYLFLFLLGLNVGVKEEIVRNIGRLGVEAFILTAGALAGSIIVSYFVYRHFFKETANEK
jgi:uncharacterized membrane protein YbjE (DUF340 family)